MIERSETYSESSDDVKSRQALRVLLAGVPEELECGLLRQMKATGHTCVHESVTTAEDFEYAVVNGGWDLVISAPDVSGMNSLTILRVVYESGSAIPCMFVASSAPESDAIEAVKAGARDFVSSEDATRLRLVLERELGNAHRRRNDRNLNPNDIPVGVFRTNPDGGVLYANSALADILGCDSPSQAADAIDSGLFEEIPLSDLRDGEVQRAEVRVRLRNDQYIWTSLCARALRDSGGHQVGHEVFVEDISRLKATELALFESQDTYRMVVERAADCVFLVDPETMRLIEANGSFRRLLGYPESEIEDLTLYDVVANDPDTIDRNVVRLLEDGSLSVGERRYRSRDGSHIDVEVSACVIRRFDQDVICVVSHDVSKYKRVEDSLRRNLDILLALREAGQILSSTLEVEEIGTRLLKVMCGVSGLTTAVIDVEDDVGLLRIWRSTGLDTLPPKARFSPEAERARHDAMESGEHQVFRLPYPVEQGRLIGLCMPLKIQDRVVGVLEAYGPEKIAVGDVAEILESLTVQAASALQNARLYDELAERERQLQTLVGKLLTAQEEERRRVAYEVHDGLAQIAAAAYQHLQAFARYNTPDDENSRKLLDESCDLMQQTVRESRRVIANLRPTALDDFGLQIALRLEVESLRNAGWNISFSGRFDDDERLLISIETALFRVFQQAIANIDRHANSKNVAVTLTRFRDRVRLRVRDYGDGFDPTQTPNRGIPGEKVGLASMRERVTLLGGKFRILSAPGLGTMISAEIPLPGRATYAEESVVDGEV